MEDRYLYKAKRKDNEEWITGALITCEDEAYKIATSCLEGRADEPMLVCAYDVDRDTICQCTGLRDKNGKLIWENDIVGLYNENKEKRYAVGSVEYGTFNCSCCEGVYGWYFDSADIRDSGRYEVIGNIFDNPELLESEE